MRVAGGCGREAAPSTFAPPAGCSLPVLCRPHHRRAALQARGGRRRSNRASVGTAGRGRPTDAVAPPDAPRANFEDRAGASHLRYRGRARGGRRHPLRGSQPGPSGPLPPRSYRSIQASSCAPRQRFGLRSTARSSGRRRGLARSDDDTGHLTFAAQDRAPLQKAIHVWSAHHHHHHHHHDSERNHDTHDKRTRLHRHDHHSKRPGRYHARNDHGWDDKQRLGDAAQCGSIRAPA